jgi:Domain of unknown function (DUF1707)/2TM domain
MGGAPGYSSLYRASHAMTDAIETSENRLRASDAERERTAEMLREHAQQGRLDVEELEERLGQAYSARTRADLELLTVDLPRRSRSRRPERARRELREHVTTFVLVNLLLIVIWAATGGGYFWPIWPIVGWGIGVACHASAVRGKRAPKRLAA